MIGRVETVYNMSIAGVFYPPQSSITATGRLVVDNGVATAHLDGEDARPSCDVEDLRIESRLGSMARKIYMPSGLLFETSDSAAVDALDGNKGSKMLAKVEKTGWHILPIAIATPILAFALYRLMIPMIINLGLFVTPSGLTQQIDRSTLATMDRVILKPTNISEARQAEFQEIFEELLAARPVDPIAQRKKRNRKPDYNLNFRDMRGIPNAFALPGGTIVLTDGLLNDFGDNDLIAGVLAHEIAHVEYEHSLRQMYRALGMAALISMVAGDAGPMLEDILLEGSAILALSFSREAEIQSDTFAVKMLHATNRPTDAMIPFFEAISRGMTLDEFNDAVRMGKIKIAGDASNDIAVTTTPVDGAWLSSHPLSQSRIDNIRAQQAALEGR